MFPVKAKSVLPVQSILIRSVAVRGSLGNMSVWVSNEQVGSNQNNTYQFRISHGKSHWTKVYQKFHAPSIRNYVGLEFENPVHIAPGQVRCFYIHSTMQSDAAIVYDDSDPMMPANLRRVQPRYQDDVIAVHSGKAHLSPEPFGRTPIWGWGNAWRDRREFVGRIEYGIIYKLWNPESHNLFGSQFRDVTQTLLAVQRRLNNENCTSIPDECIFYILNMCRWDWFGDDGANLRRLYRQRKTVQRITAMEEDDLQEGVVDDNSNEDDDDESMEEPTDVEDDGGNEEEEEEDSDDDASEQSEEIAWERAHGYRADGSFFHFQDYSSDDEEEEEDDADRRNHMHQQRGRASWLRQQFSRIHVLRALNHAGLDDPDSGN